MSKTRAAIIAATKQLVVTLPFDKITVTTIMAEAGIRRQSFYDHFRDKYDVLADIYQTEVNEAVRYCGNYEFWPQTLLAMMTYFNENRNFYQHVLQLDEQNAPEEVIGAHIKKMVGEIFTSLGEHEKISLNTDYCDFLREVLGETLFTSLKKWLYQDPEISFKQEYQFLKFYLEDGINGFLLRSKRIDRYRYMSA